MTKKAFAAILALGMMVVWYMFAVVPAFASAPATTNDSKYGVCHPTADHTFPFAHYQYIEVGNLNGHFHDGDPTDPKHGEWRWQGFHLVQIWDFVTQLGDTDCDGVSNYTPTPTNTEAPSATPTASEVPTEVPSATPTATDVPTLEPSNTPTEELVPTATPTVLDDTPVPTPTVAMTPTWVPEGCKAVEAGRWFYLTGPNGQTGRLASYQVNPNTGRWSIPNIGAQSQCLGFVAVNAQAQEIIYRNCDGTFTTVCFRCTGGGLPAAYGED